MNIDLSIPIWTIHHVAAALDLKVDTAREHTCTAAFPAPADGFSKNLWLRVEVLAWFAALPRAERRRTDGARARHSNTGTAARHGLKDVSQTTCTSTTEPAAPSARSSPTSRGRRQPAASAGRRRR